MRRAAHARCFVCGRPHEGGLNLDFAVCDDGAVEAAFDCAACYQGYDGVLHGGVTASLLDAAMTNCLFARGIAAVTAEMTVRYRHPIAVGMPRIVQARAGRAQPPLHLVEAEIVQEGQVRARAAGKFMERRQA